MNLNAFWISNVPKSSSRATGMHLTGYWERGDAIEEGER